MIELSDAHPVRAHGDLIGAADRAPTSDTPRVTGRLFSGAIRGMLFDGNGDLLVLASRGVERLDPLTLELRDTWLDGLRVDKLLRCGSRLWVIADDRLFLTEYGSPLGEALGDARGGLRVHHVAHGSKLAIVEPRGAKLFDAERDEVTSFEFDEDWFESLWNSSDAHIALLSPCGSTIGASCENSYFAIWDVATGEPVAREQHTYAHAMIDRRRLIRSDAFDTELIDLESNTTKGFRRGEEHPFVLGGALVMATTQGGCTVLDLETLEVEAEFEGSPKEYGRTYPYVHAARSDDGSRIAAYDGMRGILRCWIDGALVTGHGWSGGVQGFSVGADGAHVLVSRDWGDGRADLVDTRTRTVRALTARGGMVCAGITQDGSTLVVPIGSILRARKVWTSDIDGQNAQEVHAIKSGARGFDSWSGNRYAFLTYSIGKQGEIAMHEAGKKRALAKVKNGSDAPHGFAVGHDATQLFVEWPDAAILYDMTKRPKEVERLTGKTLSVGLGPHEHVARATLDAETIEILVRTPAGEVTIETERRASRIGALALTFDRSGNHLFAAREDGVLEIYRSATGELVDSLPLVFGSFAQVRLVGESLWCMGDDGTLHVVGH